MTTAEDEAHEELPVDVQRWKQDIGVMEEQESVEGLLARLGMPEIAVWESDKVSRDLEVELKECGM
jgi:hypothetical protein